MKLEIRHAKSLDLKEINKIYNFYIKETPYTFDIKEKSLKEKELWFKQFKKTGSTICIVASKEGKIIGYSSSVIFRQKEAYRNSIESSVYIKKEHIGKGYGKLLMSKLIDFLKKTKVKRIYALITYPNKSSVILHKSLGFKRVGKLNDVGLKFDKYWNVEIYELKI